ncbi:hypothetical protein [Streptomyces cinereoruber]|uniref:hypothetical protein n=1 Tax=Streptomyces cinereoruber TaxID=67260 RepID=UPI003C2EDF11
MRGSSLVVHAVIAVTGVEMLRRAGPSGAGTSSTAAAPALATGLLPAPDPGPVRRLPRPGRTILDSGVVTGTPTAVLLGRFEGRSEDRSERRGGEPEPRAPE